MGLQGPADWMVVPVTAGPVDDEHPAGQLEAEREEEKRSPAVAYLVKHSTTTQLRRVDLNECLTTADKVVSLRGSRHYQKKGKDSTIFC